MMGAALAALISIVPLFTEIQHDGWIRRVLPSPLQSEIREVMSTEDIVILNSPMQENEFTPKGEVINFLRGQNAIENQSFVTLCICCNVASEFSRQFRYDQHAFVGGFKHCDFRPTDEVRSRCLAGIFERHGDARPSSIIWIGRLNRHSGRPPLGDPVAMLIQRRPWRYCWRGRRSWSRLRSRPLQSLRGWWPVAQG